MLGFSCRGDDAIAFVFYWGDPPEPAVAALSVVPYLKVLKHGVGQLEAGVPDPDIEKFNWHSRPKRLIELS